MSLDDAVSLPRARGDRPVEVVRGAWNETLFTELERFPDGGHDDIVDACADAFAELPSATPLRKTLRAEML